MNSTQPTNNTSEVDTAHDEQREEQHYTMSATYSPDDNKLRLSSFHRLDAETYARVKAAGFRWAPKQSVFVAPMWTPQREDLLIELCGEIDDDDISLVDRAEERADRFDSYSVNRKRDADSAHRAVASIADNIPFGQPILVGHHSERRARKDQERIHNGMRRAVKMWETAQYWTQRAAGALQHAKYKELPGVRHRRIKGIEADKRKAERDVAHAEKVISMWESRGLNHDRALIITNMFDHIYRCFPLSEYPREAPISQYEGDMSLWSALDRGIITAEQARDISLPSHRRSIAHNKRWIAHYENRLAYERAMLNEQGGAFEEKFSLAIGGRVLIGGEWLVILRVNKAGGVVNSITTTPPRVVTWSKQWKYGIEVIKDYRAPEEGAAAKVKAATSKGPMTNYPGEGVIHMTKVEWENIYKDGKWLEVVAATEVLGRHRVRVVSRHSGQYHPRVFLTDAKRVDPPAKEPTPEPESFKREFALPVASAAAQELKQADESKAKFEALRDQLKEGVQIIVAPQLFPTPPALALRMVRYAKLEAGMRVLEPSAGTGAILEVIRAEYRNMGGAVVITAVESNLRLADRLRVSCGFDDTRQGDFLAMPVESFPRFDAVIMNPPFENGADIAHIKHALQTLKPGGRLVALCANGPRQEAQLKPIVEMYGGVWEDLPGDTFKDAGTRVRSVLLSVQTDC